MSPKITYSNRWDLNKGSDFAHREFLGDLELAHTIWMAFSHGYTYMAGDTKLSSREMLACSGSWLDESKSFSWRPSAVSRTGAAPPFRAPEVSSSRFCQIERDMFAYMISEEIKFWYHISLHVAIQAGIELMSTNIAFCILP